MLLVARYYGVDLVGQYGLLIRLLNILTILALLGLPQFIVRGTAVFETQKNHKRSNVFLRMALNQSLKVSLLLSFVLIIVFFTSKYFSLSLEQEVLLFAALSLPFYALARIFSSLHIGMKKAWKGNLMDNGIFSFILAIALAICILGRVKVDVLSLFTMIVVSKFISVFISYLWSEQKVVLLQNALRSGRIWIEKNLLFSSLVFVMLSNADGLILNFFVSKNELGVYVICSRVTMSASLVANSLASVYSPHLASSYSNKNWEQFKSVALYSVKVGGVLSLLFVATIFFFGDVILSIFNVKSEMAYYLLLILSIGSVVQLVLSFLSQALNMVHLEKIQARISLLSILVYMVASFILVPLYGVLGMGMVIAFVVLMENLLRLYFLKRRTYKLFH